MGIKEKILFVAIFLLLAGCAQIELPSTLVNESTESIYPTPKLEITFRSLCSNERVIEIEQLNISKDVGMLLSPEQSIEYWDDQRLGLYIFSSDQNQPVKMQSLESDDYINSALYFSSPDGRWVVFTRKKVVSGEESTWIASVAGSPPSMLTLNDATIIGGWLNNDFLLLYDRAAEQISREYGPSEDVLLPVAIVNPFNNEYIHLNGLSSAPVYGIGPILFLEGKKPYLLYQQDIGRYFLFDYSSQSTYPVLSWLNSDRVRINPTKNGKLLIVVPRIDGFDISGLLGSQEVINSSSYQAIMRYIETNNDIDPQYIIDNTWDINGFGFVGTLRGEVNLYWMNTSSSQVTDYCFALSNYTVSSNLMISPDRNLFSISQYGITDGNVNNMRIHILDLGTGDIAELVGFQIVGWASFN